MFLEQNLLTYILLTPVLGVSIMLVSKQNVQIKSIALNSSSITFIISLLTWTLFKKNTGSFQFISNNLWVSYLNLNCGLGIDGISLFFLLLTTLLFPLCIVLSWNKTNNIKNYFIAFLILEFFLIGAFCSAELFMFYIFFESVLIPMFLIIGIWGSRERKVKASYYFFLYTLFGSILMLLSIIYAQVQLGTTNYEVLLTFSFSELEQKLIWFSFFVSFASKVPSLPVHLWLPEAHVEAPTAGSIILAGVLLKLGTYGFIRFSIPVLPTASFYFAPLIYCVSIVSLIYTSFTAIRQTDFKRIIAYTSIAHMNLVVLGIFSFNLIGVEGAILQCLSHGFVASALFLMIGIFYDRHHTKIIKYYGGLVHVMPVCIIIFCFFTLANLGLPGTSSFVGEFLILTGLFKISNSVGFFGSLSMVLSGCYSLWLFNRISYGNLKTQYCKQMLDINKREFLTMLPLALFTLFIGINPNIFLTSIHMSVNKLIELVYFFTMIYVLKTQLPTNKSIFIALSSIYGIGLNRSKLICKKLGFLPNLKVRNMSEEQVLDLLNLIESLSSNIAFGSDLKKLLKQNENSLALINSYRGIRLKKGLPVRGQRTHSNAQTAARFVNRYQEQQKSSQKPHRKIRKKK
jgi:proton-translocating NADH-quinone oxidoreductase chain M